MKEVLEDMFWEMVVYTLTGLACIFIFIEKHVEKSKKTYFKIFGIPYITLYGKFTPRYVRYKKPK